MKTDMKMKTDTQLHHFSKKIAPGSLKFVLDLFAQLGCDLFYMGANKNWALVEQKGTDVKIQLIESSGKILSTKAKENSHIGFISSTPEKDIAKLKRWVERRGKKFVQGGWSDKELYFDCPEVFVDFIVEIMNTSILKD